MLEIIEQHHCNSKNNNNKKTVTLRLNLELKKKCIIKIRNKKFIKIIE